MRAYTNDELTDWRKHLKPGDEILMTTNGHSGDPRYFPGTVKQAKLGKRISDDKIEISGGGNMWPSIGQVNNRDDFCYALPVDYDFDHQRLRLRALSMVEQHLSNVRRDMMDLIEIDPVAAIKTFEEEHGLGVAKLSYEDIDVSRLGDPEGAEPFMASAMLGVIEQILKGQLEGFSCDELRERAETTLTECLTTAYKLFDIEDLNEACVVIENELDEIMHDLRVSVGPINIKHIDMATLA